MAHLSPTTNKLRRRSYAFGLDLVRFGAASLVAFFHFTFKLPGASIAALGWIGVQVFFVISGLVIVNSADNVSPSQFARSRFLRLYPAALLCAAIDTVALYAGPGPLQKDLLLKVTKSILLLPRGPWIASAYWTLPIEIAFYVLVFLLLQTGQLGRIRRAGAMLTICCAVFVGLLWEQQLGAEILPRLDYEYGMANITLLRHGEFFVVGILMLSTLDHGATLRLTILLAVALITGVCEIYLRATEYAAIDKLGLGAFTLGSYAVILWFAALAAIWYSVRNTQLFESTPRLRKIIRQLGLMSYPLYLLHECVGFSIMRWAAKHEISSTVAIATAYAIAVALSFLVSSVLEPQVRNFFSLCLSLAQKRIRINSA